MVEYKAKNGKIQYKPQLGVDFDESALDDNIGFCHACGEMADGVEPDAAKYECEACGQHKVYGLMELALMGLVA